MTTHKEAYSALIKLAAEMAMKRNMPDVEQVVYSVNIPKKTWRSLKKMFIKSTQQCNDWAYELRKNIDLLYAVEPNTVTISTAEYEQMKADVERLDFVQAQSIAGMSWVARNGGMVRGYRLHQDPNNIHGYSVREAIDQTKESA